MLQKIEIQITIEIEDCGDGTFDVVLKRSSIPHVEGMVTSSSAPKEFGRKKFNTRNEAEEEAQSKRNFFEKDS